MLIIEFKFVFSYLDFKVVYDFFSQAISATSTLGLFLVLDVALINKDGGRV